MFILYAPAGEVGTAQAFVAEFELAFLDDEVEEFVVAGGDGACFGFIVAEGAHAHFLDGFDGFVGGAVVELVEGFGIHQEHVGVAEDGPVDVAARVAGADFAFPVDAVFAYSHSGVGVHSVCVTGLVEDEGVVADRHVAALVTVFEFEVECRDGHHL